ncbi:hypothetical protein IWX90DRAFT_423297 [Phyllosticta citrichinensis]|uniref:Secreted protein n=1 Tax=Phyllosticta citrichinensis TaxID=1130410 RepID=A0ABR1Y2A2_9PEZI
MWKEDVVRSPLLRRWWWWWWWWWWWCKSAVKLRGLPFSSRSTSLSSTRTAARRRKKGAQGLRSVKSAFGWRAETSRDVWMGSRTE